MKGKRIISALLCFMLMITFICVKGQEVEVAAFAISASTPNTGNIFFDNDCQALDFEITNPLSESVNAKWECKISILDENEEYVPYDTLSGNIVVGAGTTAFKIVIPYVMDYGIYNAEFTLSGTTSTGTVFGAYSIPFSKCVENDTLNYSLGSNPHITKTKYFTEDGDVEAILDLYAKSGMGLLRDEFQWAGYESWLLSEKGKYALSDRQIELLRGATERGIKILALLGIDHPSYDEDWDHSIGSIALPNDANAEAGYVTYLTKLFNEPEFIAADIEEVEISNEPDLLKFIGNADGVKLNGTNIENDYTFKGEQLARIFKLAYNTINGIDENIKVGVGSLSANCRINSPNVATVKSFTDAFLNKMKEDGEYYFDVLTLHPYMTKNDPEAINDTTAYYVGLLNGEETGADTGNTYNTGVTETWHTEFGWKGIENGPEDSRPEYWQGVSIIRQYAAALANNNNDKVYIYNFADKGADDTDQENCFGMIRAEDDEVPYEAKPVYLQISNLNKRTSGKTVCDKISVSDSDAYVYRFSTGNNDEKPVYMMCTTKDTASVSLDLGDTVLYYDIYGNILDESDVFSNGEYILSQTPFYASVGEVLSDELDVDSQNRRVTIRGYVGGENVPVTITVAKPGVDESSLSSDDYIYVDAVKTDEKGRYAISFVDMGDDVGNYTIRLRVENDLEVMEYSYGIVAPSVFISENGVKIGKLSQITGTSLKAEMVMADPIGYDADALFVCAQYNDNLLVNAVSTPIGVTKAGTPSVDIPIEYLRDDGVNKIRLFFWNMDGMSPIVDSVTIE